MESYSFQVDVYDFNLLASSVAVWQEEYFGREIQGCFFSLIISSLGRL